MSTMNTFCLYILIISTLCYVCINADTANIVPISPLSNGKHYLFTPPALCGPAKRWTFKGRDIVMDYKGRILLLSFIPLGCGEQCEKQLEKYKTIVERLNGDVDIMVIARFTESAELVRQMADKYPSVRIEHEKKEELVWSWLGAQEHDHFIFDRCSRLAKYVHHNQTNPMDDNFHDTFLALKSAIDYATCGWCEYNLKRASGGNTSSPSIIQSIAPENVSRPKKVLTPIPEVQPPKITINIRSKQLHEDLAPVTSYAKPAFRQIGLQNSVVGQQLQGEVGQQPSQYRHHYASSTITTSTSPQFASHAQIQHPQHQQQQELARQREEQQRINQYRQQQIQLQEQQRSLNAQQRGQAHTEPQQQQWPSNSNNYNQQRGQQQQQTYQPAAQQVSYPSSHRSMPKQGFVAQQISQNTQVFSNDFEGEPFKKPMTTPAPKIQYSKDAYSNRYQYRLGERPKFGGGNNYRDTERQKEYDRRQQQIKAQQQQKEQAKQLAELQRQHQLQQQLALQHQHQLLMQQQKQQEEQDKKIGQKKGSTGGEPAPLYPEGSEDYYEDYNAEWTTVTPQLQIPTPTSHPLWPTLPTLSELGKDYGLELPCASYTDEICYQQQTQLKPTEVHKCCKERILLTDQCMPGKCSNVTQQLCCIQKFLQAKLSCCLDERQLEETEPGDRFSHCCHSKFVDEEDTCCSSIYASTQWRHVHELCLPNIQMDLSKVKVPTIISGTTLVTEYDFGKTQKWRFECKYGSQVPQFSYFEDGEEYNNGKLPYPKK